ncbi:MAG: hypothetical protein IPJ25_10380 [Rhodocyclaceae bacterium]|nr:hypothetical protein [Rhodocyclaceae bacterium]
MRILSLGACVVGIVIVTIGLIFIAPLGKGLLTLAWALLYAAFLPKIIIEGADWLFGRGRRAALYGKGRQANWTHTGVKIRGDVDAGGELWISLSDCALASGLSLEKRLDWVATTQKRKDKVKGWLITKPAMKAILDGVDVSQGEFVQVNKLRVFLAREVWHEDEKARQTAPSEAPKSPSVMALTSCR